MPNCRCAPLVLILIAALQACASTAPPSVPAVDVSVDGAAQEEAMSHTPLLYVTDEGFDAYVYAYPNGKLLQELSINSPTGDCVDGGSVFITGYNAHQIYLYAHGASQPKAVLPDPGYPVGCSVDPTTHTLAVANEFDRDAGTGNVVLWDANRAAPVPTAIYSGLPFLEPEWCSYDNEGNLFVDGEDYSERRVSLAELPKGGTTFKTISLDISLGWPPGYLQWDGKHITISVQNVIYRLSFSGSNATVVGSTQLPAYWNLQGYSIVGAWGNAKNRKLIATAGESIGFFSYPSGSGPTRTLIQNYPLDTVVSPAVEKPRTTLRSEQHI